MQERYYFVRIVHADGGARNACGSLNQCLTQDAAQNVAQTAYWASVGQVPLAIEFFCLCFAKLLVRFMLFSLKHFYHCWKFLTPLSLQLLERMADFVMLGDDRSRWLTMALNAVFAVTTLSNIVNLGAYSAATYFLQRAYTAGTLVASEVGALTLAQIVACVFKKCQTIYDFDHELDFDNKGLSADSVASICESISLVFIIVAYVVAGVHCIRRFRAASAGGVTSVGNARVQRQITMTVSTVFVTFLLRSGYAVILGIARFNTSIQSYQPNCINYCLPCQGLGNIVQAWDRLTPELRDVIFLLSSPLTILVALWGTYSPLLKLAFFTRTAMRSAEMARLRGQEVAAR
jgi:hypothetical protein